MARKKKETSQDELISGLMVIISAGAYFLTRSLPVAITVFVCLLISFAGLTLYKRNMKEARLRRSGIRDIDQMDGFQFEHYLVALFKKLGYRAKRTPSTNDFGADLILEGNERVVIQAKRYKNKVGIKAVQEIVSAREYYKAKKAWVICNNFFTSQAVKLAQSTDVKLIDRNELQSMILKINPSVTPSEIRKTVDPLPVKCGQCGSPMVIRKGKNGDFFGCSHFPACRSTRAIAK